MIPLPPSATLFPYTTLFRSVPARGGRGALRARWLAGGARGGHHGQLARCARGGDRHLAAARRALHRSRSEEHTSELQSRFDLVCRLLLEKKNLLLRLST